MILASAWLTWRFIRGAADAWMPSAVVSYLCLYPLCAAGWTAAAGQGGAAVAALLAWAIRVCLALIAAMGTYLALGFRPTARNIRAYTGMAAMVLAAAVLIGAWAASGAPGAIPASVATQPDTPTATLTPTLEPSITPTLPNLRFQAPTPTVTATLTAAFPLVQAVVHGTGAGGVFLRFSPDGKKIDSLNDGDVVVVIGPPVQTDGTWWIPVRTASRAKKAGWRWNSAPPSRPLASPTP